MKQLLALFCTILFATTPNLFSDTVSLDDQELSLFFDDDDLTYFDDFDEDFDDNEFLSQNEDLFDFEIEDYFLEDEEIAQDLDQLDDLLYEEQIAELDDLLDLDFDLDDLELYEEEQEPALGYNRDQIEEFFSEGGQISSDEFTFDNFSAMDQEADDDLDDEYFEDEDLTFEDEFEFDDLDVADLEVEDETDLAINTEADSENLTADPSEDSETEFDNHSTDDSEELLEEEPVTFDAPIEVEESSLAIVEPDQVIEAEDPSITLAEPEVIEEASIASAEPEIAEDTSPAQETIAVEPEAIISEEIADSTPIEMKTISEKIAKTPTIMIAQPEFDSSDETSIKLFDELPTEALAVSKHLNIGKVFAGSPVIYSLLFFMSTCSFGIWFYNLYALRKNQFMPKKTVKELKEKLTDRRYEEALSLCKGKEVLFCRMLASGISYRNQGYQTMLDNMKSEGRRATVKYWQRMTLLNDVAIIAPMLGLLGTVIGMFYAFYDINRSKESVTALFDGLGISVGTTVAGLVVAILAMIFYSTSKYRLVRILTSVENEAYSFANIINQQSYSEPQEEKPS